MSLASTIGLNVPVHGLVHAKDHTMTYLLKDLTGYPEIKKLQSKILLNYQVLIEYTKYKSTMEEVADVIAKYCTYPKVEFVKLLKLTLFNFLLVMKICIKKIFHHHPK